ncbi:RDD family protein [Paenibacillus sp. JX-17]|uniref:RDD family protein n=2 Tax=Paenibacillus lacisoli TaxID=3064525 RepID=A0ABT9CE23_9BACL|nr:RDD family protein [Paenibacillus sp. JX-17]
MYTVGFWRRLGAVLLDGLIIGVPLSILSVILFGSNDDQDWFTRSLDVVYEIVVPVFWAGRTIGKRFVGVRIRRLDGEPPGFGTMILRVIVGGLIYAVTFGVALIISVIMVVVREDNRSIHDFIAGTEVVRDEA